MSKHTDIVKFNFIPFRECNKNSLKKIEETNSDFQMVENKRQEAKQEFERIQIEKWTLQMKESELKNIISNKQNRVTALQNKNKEIKLQLNNVSWRKKIINAKYALERNNRNYYDSLMDNFSCDIPLYMRNGTDKCEKNIETEKEITIFNKRIQELENIMMGKQIILNETDEAIEIIQKSLKLRSEKIEQLKTNLQNIKNRK